jgi:hypothetical protein
VLRFWLSLAWALTGVGLLLLAAALWVSAVATGDVVALLRGAGVTLAPIGLLVRFFCWLSAPAPITMQKRQS